MRKLKLCGYDLNGLVDRVAKNWTFTARGDTLIGGEHLSQPIFAPSIVRLLGDRKPCWVGGAQASFAPHGRGGGWGDIGKVENRMLVREVLADQGADRDQLAACMSGLASGARFSVVSIDEHDAAIEQLQERLISAIAKARLGRPLLVWRSVLVVLGQLLDAGEAFAPKDKMKVGVISHNASGLSLQTLILRSTNLEAGPEFAPERRQNAELVATSQGYDGLLKRAQTKFERKIDLSSEQCAQFEAQLKLALHGRSDEVLTRNSRGAFVHIPAFDCSAEQEPIEGDVFGKLDGCDIVLFETLSEGSSRKFLFEDIQRRLSLPLILTKPEVVARGALEAARRLSNGYPVYFDFLPTISTIVLKDFSAKNFDLVNADETLPAGRIYRSKSPAKFAMQPGQSSISIYLKKQMIDRPRKAKIDIGAGADEIVPVGLSVEQAPAAGRAKLIVESPSLSRQFFIDWDTAEELSQTWGELLEELSERSASIPKRLVLPSSMDLWNGIDGNDGIADIVTREALKKSPDWETLAKAFSRSYKRAYPITSEGEIPKDVDDDVLRSLDDLTNRAMADVMDRLEARRPGENETLQFLTWQFKRVDPKLTSELLQILHERNSKGRHATVRYPASWVLFYQGVGRTCSDTTREQEAINVMLHNSNAPWNWRHQTAALAFILSRSDTAPMHLSQSEVSFLTSKALEEFSEQLGTKYTKFNYAPFLIGGLMRWRLKSPNAFMLGSDPLAEKVQAAILKTIADLQRLSRYGWQEKAKAERYTIVLEGLLDELNGVSSNPDLLMDLFNL